MADIRIDRAARRLWRAQNEAHLTATEFELLCRFAERPGVVWTRPQLLTAVWGWSDDAAERTVDSHVRSIRRKLGRDCIRTVHGVGYGLRASPWVVPLDLLAALRTVVRAGSSRDADATECRQGPGDTA